MNEHGLTVTYNLAYSTDKPRCYVPLSMVLQEMLETCRNTDEAVKFLVNAKQGGHDALLMLADADDNIKTVEITALHNSVREPADGQIFNTNHFQTEEMQRYEIPHNAVYHGNVPGELAGQRIFESSDQRLQRAETLVKRNLKITEKMLARLMRDHGENGVPSRLSICRHDPLFASTIRSMIFYPQRRTFKVLYGNPCQSKYSEHGFQPR